MTLPPCSLSRQGRDFSFDDCGRAFTCLPVEAPGALAEALVCNLDSLLGTMTHRVCVACGMGPWARAVRCWAPWRGAGFSSP